MIYGVCLTKITENNMKKYIFIGNEKDELTRLWGLKKNLAYEISFSGFKPIIKAIIKVDGRHIFCPYSSWKTFYKNWKNINI